MVFTTFNNDDTESIDPIFFFKSLAEQENISLRVVVTQFIRDYNDKINTPHFYYYKKRTGFTLLSSQELTYSFSFLTGLSYNDKFSIKTVYDEDDDDKDLWYLRDEDSEISNNNDSHCYFEPFVFRIHDVVEYLKGKNILLPEYINSKLTQLKTSYPPEIIEENIINKNSPFNIETLNTFELKDQIKLAGEKYIELTKLLLSKIQSANEQDLLELTLQYRDIFWANHLENNPQVKKAATIAEIQEHNLSENKASAIELISCPMNRDRKK